MTRKEYNEYVDTVEKFFDREGINNLSQVDSEEESYFSWSSCDCCNSGLGGDRYHSNGFRPTPLSEVSFKRVLSLLWSVICLLWSVTIQPKSFDSSLRRIKHNEISIGDILEYEICSDCLYYAEYGCLDDMTMMDIEEEVDEIPLEELEVANN
jgi:hypothetical protein